jgi:hypothetical protein
MVARAVAMILLVALTPGGCGRARSLPERLVGTYEREPRDGVAEETLTVATTRLSLSGNDDNGVSTFDTVACDSDTSCTFSTRDGCTGTLTRTADGRLVVDGHGVCSWYEGTWVAHVTR